MNKQFPFRRSKVAFTGICALTAALAVTSALPVRAALGLAFPNPVLILVGGGMFLGSTVASVNVATKKVEATTAQRAGILAGMLAGALILEEKPGAVSVRYRTLSEAEQKSMGITAPEARVFHAHLDELNSIAESVEKDLAEEIKANPELKDNEGLIQMLSLALWDDALIELGISEPEVDDLISVLSKIADHALKIPRQPESKE